MANNCESATDENVDLENTWATNASVCEEGQIDYNLVLTRSFISDKPAPTTSKVVNFIESPNKSTPDANIQAPPVSFPSIDLPQPTVKANDDLLISSYNMTPKPSAKVKENYRHHKEATQSKKSSRINPRSILKKAVGLSTMMALVSVSSL